LWIATYPDDWAPHNNLSTALLRLNQFEDARQEGQTAVRLAPNSVIAYQQLTRAELLLDRFSDAKAVIADATARGLESSVLHQLAFNLAFIDKDAIGMREHLRAASGRPDGYLILTEAARAAFATGDLDGSRKLYEQAVAGARTTRISDIAGSLLAEQAVNDALLGDADRARAELQAATSTSGGAETTWTAAMAAALLGQAPLAAQLAKAYQAMQPPAPDIVNAQVPLLQGAIALANHDGSAALAALNRASSFEGVAGPWLPYLRGLSYQAMHAPAQAAPQFRGAFAHPGNQPTYAVQTIARLQLARAERDAGNAAPARQAYANFAGAMPNATPRHPLLAAATREAAALPGAAPAPTR
jgi:tetratricopeptide (TPR) repeat protein